MSHASHLFFNFEKDKKIKINCNDILKENQKKDFSGRIYHKKSGRRHRAWACNLQENY